MHGQKRSEYKSRLQNPEAASKLSTKAQQWNALSHELLTQRQRLFVPAPSSQADADAPSSVPSPEILLTLTEKMLTVNSDPSHLWNIRREMVLYLIRKDSSSFCVEPELVLTANCLQRNPKSYSTWFHRKWSIAYLLSHGSAGNGEGDAESLRRRSSEHALHGKTILQNELELCARFLMMDERNFHCWNYRRFVVALLGSFGSIVSTSGEDEANSDGASGSNSYNGAWGVWANLLEHSDTEVLMGAQLSSTSLVTKGNVPDSNEGDSFNNIHQTAPLPKTELNILISSEWEFTMSKIQDNFSNGSAFHYRSKLLPIVLEARLASGPDEAGGSTAVTLATRQNAMLKMAREEWEEILLNAVFTEPDDQTPWWYHRFIVAWAKPAFDPVGCAGEDYDELVDDYEELLTEMADSLRELLEVEKESGGEGETERDESKGVKCKWAYLGLHNVLSSLVKLQRDNTTKVLDEAQECLNALTDIDPCRSERYKMLAHEMTGYKHGVEMKKFVKCDVTSIGR